MTAINVVLERDRVHVITDGAAIDNDGRLAFVAPKAVAIPHLNAVLAVRGQASFLGGMLSVVSAFGPVTFDELKGVVAERLRAALEPGAAAQKADGGGDFVMDLIVAGISESAGPACYMVASHDGHGPAFPAWTRTDFDFGLMTPEGDELAGEIEPLLGASKIEDVALRMLEAQRTIRVPHGNASGACVVGGFAQLTTVGRDGITSTILKRWSDRPGEPIGPCERVTGGHAVPPGNLVAFR